MSVNCSAEEMLLSIWTSWR